MTLDDDPEPESGPPEDWNPDGDHGLRANCTTCCDGSIDWTALFGNYAPWVFWALCQTSPTGLGCGCPRIT